jgi:hypothetical protein
LAIERGLFRVAIPWPPAHPDGPPMNPEFKIEVVRDPTGCNTSAQYGLASAYPMVSVFRRPRIAANMKYVDVKGPAFAPNTGLANLVDPQTKQTSNMNLTADARLISLSQVTRDMARHQLERPSPLTDDQLSRLLAFQRQVYVAQSRDAFGDDFAAPGAPAALGPRALFKGPPGVPGPVLDGLEAWK